MRVLRNKNGMAYVLTCVILLVAMMLGSLLLQYAQIVSAVEAQKKDAQIKLDSVILKSAMENYDALKQGSLYPSQLDFAKLEQDAYVALGFGENGATVRDGIFTVREPQITSFCEGGFGLNVKYELEFPFLVLGEDFGNVTIPVTLTSKFREK